MKRILFASLICMMAAVAGFADIARPEPSKTPKTKSSKSIATSMMIRLDKDATEAVLRIPKSQIKQLRAALDDLDQGSNTAEVETPSAGSFTRTQSIVSGMFMSLALVFGGIWFVRSGKLATRSGKTFVILALMAGVGAAATFVYANAGPPAEARSITGKMFTTAVHMYGVGSGSIRLETKDDQFGVELIVPNPPDKPKADE